MTDAKPSLFLHPPGGNLRLRPRASADALDKVRRHRFAQQDVDGEVRPAGRKTDIGADEFKAEFNQ